MNDGEMSLRTDPQLIASLDETAVWTVRGERGAPLGQTASLRDALILAADLERDGRPIVALTQQPRDRIIVFPAQMDRLAEASAG